MKHQIDNLKCALMLFLVDGTGGSSHPCFLNIYVSFYSINTILVLLILIKNANRWVFKYVKNDEHLRELLKREFKTALLLINLSNITYSLCSLYRRICIENANPMVVLSL
jgi:hypothetical protein